MANYTIIFLALLALSGGVFTYLRTRKLTASLVKREEEMRRRIYELAILKELGERIGYSLNVQNIIDIITGSLHQFIEYSVVSYMLLEPEKVIFKASVEKSVSRDFIADIRSRMIRSLSALLERDFSQTAIEEVISGAILLEEVEDTVSSFFNIPLVIAGKLVGVLTVAHTVSGLYKEEEMTILYKITSQASQAVTKLQEVVGIEQRKLNAMVESMTEGVVMTDKDYRVLVANPAAKRAVGLTAVVEPSIFDFIDHLEGKFDIRGRLEESVHLDQVLISKEVLLGERFFQIIVSPVKTSFGPVENEVLGGVVIFHDITKEKEVERIKEEFTSMIAHELRSPLDGVKKISELIMKSSFKKKERDEYLQTIYRNSAGLLELVNNLLDAAKLEAGKFEILKRPVDFRELVGDRLGFFKTPAESAGVRLRSSLDKNLPAAVDGDPYRLSQVLNNLLSNALKFTPAGGQVSVIAFIHRQGQKIEAEINSAGVEVGFKEALSGLAGLPDSLIVAVEDTGAGFSSAKARQLFHKFKTLGSAGEKGGTGLGLVIAKGIVEAHRGQIGAASREGRGSLFYFTLPQP